jgi:hypothetical protein
MSFDFEIPDKGMKLHVTVIRYVQPFGHVEWVAKVMTSSGQFEYGKSRICEAAIGDAIERLCIPELGTLGRDLIDGVAHQLIGSLWWPEYGMAEPRN